MPGSTNQGLWWWEVTSKLPVPFYNAISWAPDGDSDPGHHTWRTSSLLWPLSALLDNEGHAADPRDQQVINLASSLFGFHPHAECHLARIIYHYVKNVGQRKTNFYKRKHSKLSRARWIEKSSQNPLSWWLGSLSQEHWAWGRDTPRMGHQFITGDQTPLNHWKKKKKKNPRNAYTRRFDNSARHPKRVELWSNFRPIQESSIKAWFRHSIWVTGSSTSS